MNEILITVNSPGEVSTWLIPVMREIQSKDPRAEVTVFILPCTYASGTEAAVVQAIPGVRAVISPGASLAFALWGKKPAGWEAPKGGVLLFLGGEFKLAARIARRLGMRAMAYSEGYINTASAFGRVFAPREQSKERLVGRGVAEQAVSVVGDLMVDAALGGERLDAESARRRLGLTQDAVHVALLFGSRPFEVRIAVDLFLRAAAALIGRARAEGHDRSVGFLAPVAPYVERQTLDEAIGALLRRPGSKAELDLDRLFPEGGPGRPDAVGHAPTVTGTFWVEGERVQVVFCRERTREAMAAADIALALPGSNNAELAAWGVPMVVCIDLDRAEEIPIEGIFGLVDRIPLVGRSLKRRAVLSLAERLRYTSLPNRIADRFIVPELRGVRIDPQDVAEEAWKWVRDEGARREVSRALLDAMGPTGAAGTVAEAVLAAARGDKLAD